MYQIHNSATFYVSQTEGDDSKLNGFSPTRDEFGNGPFRTVEHALSRIRVMRKTGVDRPFTIALTEDYPLSAPLSLTDGIDGITLTSHGRRHRLMGGIRLDGWTRDFFGKVPCLSAPIPKGKDGKLLDFTDLFDSSPAHALGFLPLSEQVSKKQ